MGFGIDKYIDILADVLPVPPDLIRIFLCLTLSFPLSSVVKRIPASSVKCKELFTLLSGLFFLLGIFNLKEGALMLLFSSMTTYALLKVWPNRWFMPWVNFLVTMGLMLFTHCKEQFSDRDYVNEISISGSQMILVIKLTSIAWDVYDGTREKAGSLSDFQINNLVPTAGPHELQLLRYLSWVFFFPSILTGPSSGYREYSEWIDLSLFKSCPSNAKGTKIVPSSGGRSIHRALEGIIWAIFYMKTAPLLASATGNYYAKLPFINYDIFGRIGYVWLLTVVYRIKFYCAWCISEAACIHCGLGFNGYDPKTNKISWDRVRNVNPLQVELAQNAHDVFANWNMNTSKWLRHYVYLRITPKGKKPGSAATIATFTVSALWHGTRPGYYLTFIMAAFLQIFGRIYRKTIRPVFLGTSYKAAYDIITVVITQISLSYVAQPFVLLGIRPSLEMWKSLYFFVHIGMLISWLTLAGPLKPYFLLLLKSLHSDLEKND